MTSAIPPGPATAHPGYLLKRAQAALNAAMTAALREHGATLSQYAVLTALDEEPGLSNAGLARRSFVTPQTMNQVLRELEQKGWVARHPDPGHARILQAGLTPPGRTALRACHRAVNAIEEQMLAPLTPGDIEQLTATLQACIQALSPATAPGAGDAALSLRPVGEAAPAVRPPAGLACGHRVHLVD